MKTLLQLRFALIILLLPFVSISQFVDYDRDTKWNIGFNLGGVWQDGDIKLQRPGFGHGFTIGKGIYESPSRFWSVDLRFRYLKGFTYGQDLMATDSSNLEDNTIYSVNPTDYKNNIGFTFYNNKTTIHDFSLEAVLNFHALREKTGVLLSVFGGVGITDYRTKTNLVDENGKIYNYLSLDSANATLTDFKNMHDDTYEENARFNDGESANVKFMPSLGIGLGYQITPKFSIGFEHRVTFALQDKFDGVEKPGTQFLQWGDNDKYHYSSLFLRWNIFKGKDSDPVSQDNCPPPYVKISDVPKRYKVNKAEFDIKARITKIKSNNDVIFVHNEQVAQTIYNRNTDFVTGKVILEQGENKLTFIATNACGEAQDEVIVIYNPEYCPKPIVEITELPKSVSSRKSTLKAKVLDLQGGSIVVKLNQEIVKHSFNSLTNKLSADLDLRVGNNNVTIFAKNKCGDTLVSQNIEYNCIAPKITVTSPENGTVYKSAGGVFSGKVTNISSLSQVSMTMNGIAVTPNLRASNGDLSANFTMREGANTLSVIVTNDCGTDSKQIQFVYEKPCLLPVISITSPRNNQNVTNPSINFRASVANITNVANVSLRVNGALVNSSLSSGTVTASINLREGANTIELTGINNCGQDRKSIVVNYTCPKPIIALTSPRNGSTLSSTNVVINGSVTNVSNKNEMTLMVNGYAIPFTFNAGNRTFSANALLNKGQNSIVATATSSCGNATTNSSVTIIDEPCPSPVVIISTPNGGTSSSSQVTLAGSFSNVSSKSQLSVRLNGVNQTFTFNATARTYSALINLIQGNNSIVVSANTNCGNDTKTVNVVYNKACPKPVVSISSPRNGLNATSLSVPFTGLVQNVQNASQVTLKLNGTVISKNFNSTAGVVSTTLNLKQGGNTVELLATNACGAATATSTVSFRCPLPTINISSPNNGMKYTTSTVGFSGFVSGVSAQSQISIQLNGTIIPFNYDTRASKFSGNMNLITGKNELLATVTNQCGSVNKSVIVSYSKPCPKPSVIILNPKNGSKPASQTVSISGNVYNINSKSELTLKSNGTIIPFTYNTSAKTFVANHTLAAGSNVITATVSNACGTDTKSVTIDFSKPCPKPIVSITSPLNGGVLNVNSTVVSGSVSNINVKTDMQLKVNGVVTNFTYNSGTKIFSANVNLREGNNNVTAVATTNCGSATSTVNLTYKKPCVPPVVSITAPVNGIKISTGTVSIKGTAINIKDKTEMTVTVNGTLVNFNYDLASKQFSTTGNLKSGSNTIVVTAKNACGNASKSTVVTYTPPCPKPTISILKPSNGLSIKGNKVTVSGVATNLVSKTDMQVKLNGVDQSFTYNASTKSYLANLTLRYGNNTILVQAATNCGTDSKTITVTSVKLIKPIINVYSLSKDTSVSSSPQVSIVGSVELITGQSKFEVLVNGSTVSGYAFSKAGTEKYIFDGMINLVPGKNVIVFRAVHVTGGVEIIYKVVTFSNSVTKPKTRTKIDMSGSKSNQGGTRQTPAPK